MLTFLASVIWSEAFWFPTNYTWEEFHRPHIPGQYKPLLMDLLYVLPCSLCVYFIRYFVEQRIIRPFGIMKKIKDLKRYSVPPNKYLEAVYSSNKRPDPVLVKELSGAIQASPTFVSNWFRRRRNMDKSSPLKKFCETGWRCLYYSLACVYGFLVVTSHSFFWDTKDCWRGWPHLHVSRGLFWYYMIQLSFYCTSVFCIFTDVKRKDFREMFLHHVLTIILMLFSWTGNCVRIGSLIMLVHDISDPLLEGGKLTVYLKLPKRVTTIFTVIFTLSWFVCRIVIFPTRILYSIHFEGHAMFEPVPAGTLLLVFLCMLLLLHMVWFFYIIKYTYNLITSPAGSIEKDTRSESEFSLSDDANCKTD